MKFLKSLLLLPIIALILSACSTNEPLPPVLGEEDHFVTVVLPNNVKSTAATVTLDLSDREAMTYTVPNSFLFDTDKGPEVTFNLGETVAPATLEIKFASGEIKRLEKVVFDTVLTLQ